MSAPREDRLEKGFHLAYFIISDRDAALQILTGAMNKLRSQRSRERKRSYWRNKHLKGKITRIVRNDGDALQWLIYSEAVYYEEQQERAGRHNTRDMIIRYIKHLVQMTTTMSSFYVNVGLQRLLYNYSTSEAQQAYEWVTAHHPGAEEYRKVKGALMNQLKMRFQGYIRTHRADHGELRFDVFDRQERWADLVDECLQLFTPWSVSQTHLELASLDSESLRRLDLWQPGGRGKITQDEIEIRRCHLFIDPACYRRLTETLGLDAPRQRLAVPRFFLSGKENNQDKSGDSTRKPSSLTEEERRSVQSYLVDQIARRNQASPKFLRVIANGVEYAQLEVSDDGERYCEVQESIKLIEIWTQDADGDLLLATHWLDYTELQGVAPATATVALGKSRELLLEISPVAETSEKSRCVLMRLQCRSVSPLESWNQSMRSAFSWLRGAPRYAMAFLLLTALSWTVVAIRYGRELTVRRATIDRINKELTQERAAHSALQQRFERERAIGSSVLTYGLIPNDMLVRGQQGAKEPVVSISRHAEVVMLELPIAGNQRAAYRATLRSFLEKREVLSENLLKTEQAEARSMLVLAVPSALVENKKHYVIDLYAINITGEMEKIRTFIFQVVKEKE